MKNQIPQSMTLECPDCEEETLHKTLKGRLEGKSLKLVLKCSQCGLVSKESLKLVGQTQVRMIISRGDASERTTADFPADWVLVVGEEFMHGDERLQITGIEKDGQRVTELPVGEVQTLWTRNFDQARVKVAINYRGNTRSLDLLVDPEEEFEVGSEIEIDDLPVMIHSIKTKEKNMRRGSAAARDIVRIYCRERRKRNHDRDREDHRD